MNVNRECEDPIVFDRDVLFIHMTLRVWICPMRAEINSNDFVFFELISRCEFEFRRRGIFF